VPRVLRGGLSGARMTVCANSGSGKPHGPVVDRCWPCGAPLCGPCGRMGECIYCQRERLKERR
jgi:hypothetical protein